MSATRIAAVALGLLLAAGALVLVLRGLGGTAPVAAAPASAGPETPPAGSRTQEKESPPPRWQSFQRPDERVAPLRPVIHLAQEVPDPFKRPERRVGGGGRPENPGFRLEGISAGAGAVALISGHAVREGETISGFRVVRIGRSGVALAGPQGARLDLALGEGGR